MRRNEAASQADWASKLRKIMQENGMFAFLQNGSEAAKTLKLSLEKLYENRISHLQRIDRLHRPTR